MKLRGALLILILCGGCVYHEMPLAIPCDKSDLSLEVNSVTHSSECTVADGEISLNAKGGIKPYSFSIDAGVTWVPDSNFSELYSGQYILQLKDAQGCNVQRDTIVQNPNGFNVSFVIIPDNSCLEETGEIKIELMEDPEGFLFRIDDGEFTSAREFKNLTEGIYTIFIHNAEGCTTQYAIEIPHGTTGVSWSNDILPIMMASCATSGCHDGIARRNWRDYNEVKQYASAIKTRTLDKSMPFDKTLPQVQIDKIACWVNDGAPNN